VTNKRTKASPKVSLHKKFSAKIAGGKTDVLFLRHLPKPAEIGEKVCVLFDETLLGYPEFGKWVRAFPVKVGLRAGESLKDLRSFAENFHKIQSANRTQASRGVVFCVVGGGSVGDFGAFVASVYKRGAGLVHIPSTWLAALDSAHGGKTGLNTDYGKNQVGTFYSAQKIFVVESLLMQQGPERVHDAYGELAKMALIEGGATYREVAGASVVNSEMMWRLLPKGIRAKYKIVAKDPFEQKSIRDVLNLGHTMGHVFEFECGVGHGLAVSYGLEFAIRFSRYLAGKSWDGKNDLIDRLNLPTSQVLIQELPWARVFARLCEDKKVTSNGRIKFVVPNAPGKVKVQEIDIRQIEKFYAQLIKLASKNPNLIPSRQLAGG
jgi:3-dehydroquinate synthase